MKYVKMLGLLAVAAAAMMAFAASASATTVTSTGSPTPTIHAVNENGHVELHNPQLGVTFQCPSTVEGHVTTHGAGTHAGGPITSLIFGSGPTTGCTGDTVVHVINAGTLSVTHTSGSNGTLVSNGATVVVTTIGIECRYKTENTKIGTVTGGNPATLHIEALIPRHGGSIFCGSGAAEWTGDYVTTHELIIEP